MTVWSVVAAMMSGNLSSLPRSTSSCEFLRNICLLWELILILIFDTEHDRHGWTPLSYFEQYADNDVIKIVSDCTNAVSLARTGDLLNTSVDEVYHFFCACISGNQDVLVQSLEILLR